MTSEYDPLLMSDVIPALQSVDFADLHVDTEEDSVVNDLADPLALTSTGLGLGVVPFPNRIPLSEDLVVVPLETPDDLQYVSVIRRTLRPVGRRCER